MQEPLRKHLDHVPPHWLEDGAIYFVTICTSERGKNQMCLPVIGSKVLGAIEHYHVKGRWFCHLAVVMPDHVHLLLSFPDIPSFARVIGEWKKWVVKSCGTDWQENFFDHRLRNDENFGQKAEYMLQNPVRAGLVKEAKDWPYTWMPR